MSFPIIVDLQFKDDGYADLGATGLVVLDAGLPVGHLAQHAQGLAVALRRQRLGDADARDMAVFLHIEYGDHLALDLR